MSRLQVALLFGGRSGEHDISIRSAQSVARALRAHHDVQLLFIDREGRWWLQNGEEPQPAGGTAAFLVPYPGEKGAVRRLDDSRVLLQPDIFFPVLHGPYGEDGTVQGLLELAGAPYVGSGVAASAAGMDKELMKGLFAAAQVPQPPYRVLRSGEKTDDLISAFGLPLFVKPANLGSSVGVSKVRVASDLPRALDEAFSFDRKVVVEAGIDCRELEVSVLGNEKPEASLPGEILPDRDFYDYASKYSADSKTELRIPADLPTEQVREIQSLAIRAFLAVDACGYARVDFLFDKKNDRLLVNEINTIPGFTSISMFPKLWEATGITYEDLVNRLIALGLARHHERARLKTDYRP